MSIPKGLFSKFNFLLKDPKIFPLPHPISKTLDLELILIFLTKNLLNESIYFFEDRQVLLSHFLMTVDAIFF